MTSMKYCRSHCQSYVFMFVIQWIRRLDIQSTAEKYYGNEAQDSEGSLETSFKMVFFYD